MCAKIKILFETSKQNARIFLFIWKDYPYFVDAVLGTCAEMERENIKFRLNSGKAKFMANGGKVGRKEGYKKPDESFQEEYATVIKQLRKGYPIRMIAKNCGVGISTVQRIKKKFIDNEHYDDWYYWEKIEDAAKHVSGIVGYEVEPTVKAIDEALEDYMEEHEDEDVFYSFHEFQVGDS